MVLRKYYYNQLPDPEKKGYQEILSCYVNGHHIASISEMPSKNVIRAIYMEHPELYSYDFFNLLVQKNDNRMHLKFMEKVGNENKRTIAKRINTIIAHIDATEEEMIVRQAHNYLLKNVKYDRECAISNVSEHVSHTAAGPFLHGKGVCDGISLAFKMLLDMKGIDNAVVVGVLKERESSANEPNHMWNVVSINGNNYFIDVTQDIGSTDSSWNKPSYMYYMLTDDELRKTHIWKGDFHCISIKDNPFDKYNKHFTTVSRIKSYVSSLPRQEKLIYFKCVNLPESEISQSVITALASPSNPRVSLSMVSNAGRYYFYKESN